MERKKISGTGDQVAGASRRYRRRLEELVATTEEAIIALDQDGVVTAWDGAAERLFGYRADEILGHHAMMLIPENRKHEVDAIRQVLHSGGTVKNFETWRKRKDGSLINVAISYATVLDPAKREPVGYAISVKDLAAVNTSMERACAAAAEEVTAERAMFQRLIFGVVTHELRTPLAQIIGMTELLISSGLLEDQYRLAQSVEDAAYGLLDIVNNFLMEAELESGNIKIDLAPANLHALLARLAAEFKPACVNKKIEFDCDIDEALTEPVITDARCLQMILRHLLFNSLKFTKRGRIKLTVRVKDQMEDVQTIEFKVEDSGEGLPAELSGHLFQPLIQGDISLTRKFGGAGLGLSIANTLVELLGGILALDNNANGPGTTATFDVVVRRNSLKRVS